MAYPDTSGASGAYKSRRKRSRLQKLATNIRPPKPKMRSVGGGIAAPGPYSIERPKRGGFVTGNVTKRIPFKGRKPRPKRFRSKTKAPY